jgi:mRNA-degrading endonuclease toxin of MazEF toxin-antitoxin module
VTPDRGDILHLQFDPASGREMKGDHFCLVVSPKAFNQRFKLAMVCPISGGTAQVARDTGFLVSLLARLPQLSSDFANFGPFRLSKLLKYRSQMAGNP